MQSLSRFGLRYRPFTPLIYAAGLSLLLLALRLYYTGEITFIFLVWNLFLALLPLAFSYRLHPKRPPLLNALKLILCLLFLPNAPYILTDLFHLQGLSGTWLWYDTLLIASFAFSGLLCYVYSLEQLRGFVSHWVGSRTVIGAFALLNFVNAFGIYLGRYLRFNSWDILSQPWGLTSEIAHIIIYPSSHPRAWAMTISYGLFLWVLQLAFNPSLKAKPLKS